MERAWLFNVFGYESRSIKNLEKDALQHQIETLKVGKVAEVEHI